MHSRTRSTRSTRPTRSARNSRIRRGAGAAAVALTLTAGLASATAEAQESSRPGDVVSAQAQAFKPNPLTHSDARSWKVHYRSTTATGQPNVVSGTVIVPNDGKTGDRPIVTYAVGTVGLADQCAPSHTFPSGLTKEGSLIQQALQRGWAVAVTDYEGLGTPGTHTYTVGRSAGHAVLDAARAAQRLPEAGLSAESPVGIMGYSQGGQASSWAAELHDQYAPELNVKGTATGGVPRDLMEVAKFNDGNMGSGLIAMAAVGYDAAFPELDLNKYLNARGKLQRKIAETQCVELAAGTWPFGRIEDITTTNPLNEPDWQQRLNESKLGTHAPKAPVFLYHGVVDTLIPYTSGTQLRDDWNARGAEVTWKSLPLEHVSGAIAGSPLAMAWLADRFKQ
ncbi:lipase family protein [Streptomyces gobiensis]|uniref:lipase family protein n=1 Tax=Streptomyces gobiensis TaxID=2875706 RepID=UPI001E31E71D|nr:lipase family protein [Streptomyces gobiensis]UGY92959.1 lipase family protein [Streptomyces gobiensis]